MLIGVKFCGGCNEGYVRSDAFDTLKNHFKDRVSFEFVKEGGKYDALLLLSGCTNRCASIDRYNYDGNLVSVWKPSRVEDAIEQIEDYLKDGGK